MIITMSEFSEETNAEEARVSEYSSVGSHINPPDLEASKTVVSERELHKENIWSSSCIIGARLRGWSGNLNARWGSV